MEDSRLKQICQWVYRHYPQQDGVWWIAPLLVAHPDAQHLSITMAEAEKVFETLEERGFVMKPSGQVAFHVNQNYPQYFFKADSREALRAFCGASWYYRWLSSRWAYRLERGKYWFMIAGVLIATSFFEGLFGKWGEALGDGIQKLFGK